MVVQASRSLDVVCRLAEDDAQHPALSPFYSAWNDLASTTNLVFPSDDRRVNGHRPSLSIGVAASPLAPGHLIESYSTTHGYQIQGMRARQSPIHDILLTVQVDELSLKCIDPRLLRILSKHLMRPPSIQSQTSGSSCLPFLLPLPLYTVEIITPPSLRPIVHSLLPF